MFAARIPLAAISAYLKIIIPVMAITIFLFILVQHNGKVYFQYGWFIVDAYGISTGIVGASRIGTLFFSTIGVLMTTTRERDLLSGLINAGLPFAASFLLMMSMRFVSLSMGDLQTVREARKARALPERENAFQLIRNMVSLVIPLFMVTIRRIQTASNALEVKGFSPDTRKRSFRREKLKSSEMAWIAGSIGLVAILAFMRLWLGYFVL
jgi:energy-coupling factor transport system permease protein